MSGARGKASPGPSALASDYRRKAARLLARLAEPGIVAERRETEIVLVRKAGRVSIATGLPAGILAELLECGAVSCESRQGQARFRITEEGHARLRREAAEENAFASQHRRIEPRELDLDGDRVNVRVNTREDPLGLLRQGRFANRFLLGAEIEAGERLRRDIHAAQMLPQVTANWSRMAWGRDRGSASRRRSLSRASALPPRSMPWIVTCAAFSSMSAGSRKASSSSNGIMPCRRARASWCWSLRCASSRGITVLRPKRADRTGGRCRPGARRIIARSSRSARAAFRPPGPPPPP